MIGCTKNPSNFGTLGPSFVTGGALYHVTAYHIIKASIPEMEVYQPPLALNAGKHKIGTVVQYDEAMDFCCIKHDYNRQPIRNLRAVQTYNDTEPCSRVFKIGARSGKTESSVCGKKGDAYVIRGSQDFAQSGDSGSAVLTIDGKLVGILLGADPNCTYVLSAKAISNRLTLNDIIWYV